MATEISAAGYQDFKDRVEAAWLYIELRDAAGDPVVRLGTADPRVSWIHAPGENPKLQAIVQGSDVDIPVPTTFRSSALFKVAEEGDALSVDTFDADFTIGADADQLTVQHEVQVPQVVAP
jgi:hypothetical protein